MDITFFFLAALAVGFYMAWNIGANDVANSMGTSVGSKAITLRQAVIIAGIFELTGAVFFGKHVTKTIRKGIVDPSQISDPSLVAIGAFSALFAAALWLTFATWKGLPVSTTHSIVGAMTGFGIAAGGFGIVSWDKMGKIAASWVISPLAGALVAFILFTSMRRSIIAWYPDRKRLEKVFGYFQLMTASFVAFAHGSNDVANAIGPIAAVITYSQGSASEIASSIAVPPWLLVFGGLGIVIGLATWGYRVIGTIGERVTEITPTRGFCAEFATATVVLANSQLGMPISTTHVLVGSVIGVGMARGIKALNLRIIWDIMKSWIATVPIAAVISAILFKVLVVV
jgi:PiT family inorganic phosphate transporter